MTSTSVATAAARRPGLTERLRCLALRVGRLVRVAHTGSVPF